MSAKAIIVGCIMFCLFLPWFTPVWIIIAIIVGCMAAGIVHEEDANPVEVTMLCEHCGGAIGALDFDRDKGFYVCPKCKREWKGDE